jgi:acetyltransferase-like isoleucine patch superfamily enzyme
VRAFAFEVIECTPHVAVGRDGQIGANAAVIKDIPPYSAAN